MDSLFTIIKFIFITCSNGINPKECKFIIDSEQKEFKLDEDNSIKFIPNYPKSLIYYCEKIQIIYKKKIICSFEFLVYINKINTVLIDLELEKEEEEEEKKSSFELLFYSKDINYNPLSVEYKNIKYNQFDTYGNKYRRRIFFANVNPSKLEYINSEKMNQYNVNFEAYETYQAIFRIFDYNKYEISVTNMFSYYENIDIEKKEISKIELDDFVELLENFYEKFIDYINLDFKLIKQREGAFIKLKDINENIIEHDLYNLLNKPEGYIYNNYKDEILYLFHFDFYLELFNELIEENKAEDVRTRNKILQFKKIEDKLFSKIILDSKINIEQKIKIIRAINEFLKNLLITDEIVTAIDYINIEEINKNSPYYKAKILLTKIINEMTEESRLFEAFLYFDSKVIENILIKNIQDNYIYINKFGKNIRVEKTDFITEYGMTMMSLREIQNHLLNLLPTIIIRIESSIKLRALFDRKSKLMVINEQKMFGDCFIENEKLFNEEPDNYIIPICIEILHEMLSHGKLRYNYEIDFSPLAFRDSKYNFKIQKIMKRVKLNFNKEIIVNQGESGRVLEHFISEDKELIEKLKKRTENLNIINSRFWIDKNFNDLYKEMNFNSDNNVSNYKDEIILGDSDESIGDYGCMYHC